MNQCLIKRMNLISTLTVSLDWRPVHIDFHGVNTWSLGDLFLGNQWEVSEFVDVHIEHLISKHFNLFTLKFTQLAFDVNTLPIANIQSINYYSFSILSAIYFHSCSNLKHSSEYFSPHSSLALANSSGDASAAEKYLADTAPIIGDCWLVKTFEAADVRDLCFLIMPNIILNYQ